MDDDLEMMTREQLIGEARRLRTGIRVHRDGTGHALCWHHPALWGLLPEKTDPCRRSLRGRSFSGAACGTASPWTISCLMRPAPTRRISRDRGTTSADARGRRTSLERPAGPRTLTAAAQREQFRDSRDGHELENPLG
jgi:hypothetical protein